MEKFILKTNIFFYLILIFSKLLTVNSVIVPLEPKDEKRILKTLKEIRESKITKYEKPLTENPKISIIIPVLNGEDYIKPIVVSIQKQILEDIEIIFVEDFSTDNTYKNIQKAKQLDPRIKVIKNKKNMGIMYSRMFGALESKGEYVTFLDCDDLYVDPNVLKVAYETAEEKDLDLIQYEYVGSTYDGGNTINVCGVRSKFFREFLQIRIRTTYETQRNLL